MNIIDKIKITYNLFKEKYYDRKCDKLASSIGECSTFFGMPGSGKTTYCSYVVSCCLKSKKYKKVYSNVPILGAIPFTKKEFGLYDMSNSFIIIDEGSLFYDNRNYNDNFNEASLSYLKLLRHRRNHVLIFSQSLDVDVKFLRISTSIFQLKKSCFSFTTVTKIKRKVAVNPDSHKFEDYYFEPTGFIKFLTSKHIYRPLYYKYFETYDAPKLPALPEREVYKSSTGLEKYINREKKTKKA